MRERDKMALCLAGGMRRYLKKFVRLALQPFGPTFSLFVGVFCFQGLSLPWPGTIHEI